MNFIKLISQISVRTTLIVLCGVFLGTCCTLLLCFNLLKNNDQSDREQSPFDLVGVSNTQPNINWAPNGTAKKLTLFDIISLESSINLRLEVYKLIDNKDSTGLLNLLEEIDRVNEAETTYNISIVQEVLFERLVRIAPKVALNRVWDEDPTAWAALVKIVFSEWSLINIDDAMAAAAALDNGWKPRAFQVIFENRRDLTNSQLQEIARKWDSLDILNLVTVQKTVFEMIDRPMEAIEYILNAEIPQHHRVQFITKIVSHWVEHAGVEEQERMFSVCFDLLAQDEFFYSHLVPIVSSLSPSEAWEHLQTLPAQAQQLLSRGIIAAWVKEDYLEARTAIDAIDPQEIPQKNMYLRQLFTEWARLNPEEAIKDLSGVSMDYPSIVIYVAVVGLLDLMPPKQVLQLLDDEELLISGALIQILTQWSEEDPIATVQWITESYEVGSIFRNIGLSTTLSIYALVEPKIAFELALQEPIGEMTPYTHGLEYSVVVTLANNGQYDRLEELLPQVRDPARISAYAFVGGSFIDLNRVSEAIELGKSLSETEQVQYFSELTRTWQSYNPESLIDNLSQLPTNGVRSKVAKDMLRHHEFSGIYTESEMELISTFITED